LKNSGGFPLFFSYNKYINQQIYLPSLFLMALSSLFLSVSNLKTLTDFMPLKHMPFFGEALPRANLPL
jgi:hypothetical protein